MIQPPRKKISWAFLVVLGGCLLILKSAVMPEQNTVEEIPLAIDVQMFKSPEEKASADLTPLKYKATEASENPRQTKEIYTYSPEGTLKKYTEHIQYTDIEKGLLWGKNGLSGVKFWDISENGEKTFLRSSNYTLDGKGNISKEVVYFPKSSRMEIEYARMSDGRESVVSIYAYDADGVLSLASTATYQYKNGILVSSTLTYPGEGARSTRTAYLNNTNGDPVRITVRNSVDTIISTEERGYNADRSIAYSKTYNRKGEMIYRTWYYYDKDGYLEKSVDFERGSDGSMGVSEIHTYTYFDW